MKPHTFLLAAVLAISATAAASPRLVVSTPALAPESKIELVLDSPVTATPTLGTTVANTWLDIKPALPGKLRWKAQNIAEFLPDEPPVLGTTYVFSIPKNLTHLDASPVPPGKFATIASEEFRIMAASMPNRWDAGFSASKAEWWLAFNDDTDPAAAAAFVSFRSKTGQRVAAHLERAAAGRVGYYRTSYTPWAARWNKPPAAQVPPETLLSNILIATPATPLPPGEGWQMVVTKGLPNTSAGARLTADSQYEIGKIEPFRVTGIEARTRADHPRQIVATFNHLLPKALPPDFLTSCLVIEPRPQNLQAATDGQEIQITGDLADIDKYSVTLRPPFASGDGLPLDAPRTEALAFEHLAPEVALATENQAQLANGSRCYRVQTVNLAGLHVRVKRLAGENLIRAYQGYRHYTGSGPDGQAITPTAPLPWPLVVGDPILEQTLPLDTPIDTSKEVTLRWDDLLPKDVRHAALFLDLTGTPVPGATGDGRRSTQAIIQLTDIGLAWKFTAKEALVYAFSCESGAPLPGVNLQLCGEDAAPLATTTTDASGIATLPRPVAARHLVATLDEDSYLTAFDATLATVGLWHFPVRYSWNTPPESSRKAFLFTDRSLYRPGETVHLKGIVRTLNGNAIEAPTRSPARIVIVDPTDKEILSQPVTLSESGSFDFTYTLAPAKTGTHQIRLEFPDELAKAQAPDTPDDSATLWQEKENLLASARFGLPLRVEEFRRNAFEITHKLPTPAIGATAVTAELAATYYQGQPVAGATVKHYSRVTAQNPYPERFRDFLFGNHRSYDAGYWHRYFGYQDGNDDSATNHSSQLQGETQLTPAGTATVTINLPQADFPTPREVELSAEVTDANHQTLTVRTATTVHPAAAYLGISRLDRLIRAGDVVPLTIVAVDPDGRPFRQPLKLTATLTREVNSAVKSQTATGATTTRSDRSEETISTTEFTLDPNASIRDGQAFPITPTSSGLHFFTLRGTDPQGRPIATAIRMNVYGTDEFPWLYEDGLRVKLVAEKKSYQPGETARVLVLSPIEGTALVTVEREKVLRSFLTPLTADHPVIEIPLTESDAPNAYVSVLIVKGAKESARQYKQPQLRLGYCELLVANPRETLAVTLDKPADSYRPGEEIVLSGNVVQAGGKPACRAEVTLFAEDEGTLSVTGYATPKPLESFYQPRILGVQAGTSFEAFLAEDPQQQEFHNKGFFIGGGGDSAQLAALPRKNFNPCATWAPALVTDAAGKFSHSFKLPDTLTRYRVMAIAHHETTRFGQSESAVIVKKDLMLEPKAPRFANQGDTLQPQVLVQNASRFAGTWQITLDAGSSNGSSACKPLAATTETISLAPGASATVVFPIIAQATGDAVLSWRATPVSLTNGTLSDLLVRSLSDAVEARFPVLYPMPLLRQVKFVKLDRPGVQVDLRKVIDPALLAGTGTVDVEFVRSPLAGAAGAADYLLHYPYGCVEQTTSSLMPWCAVSPLKDVIPSFAKLAEENVRAAIQAGADRLLTMQLPDGSFTYWPGGTQTVDWATPYAGMGLVLAAHAGANVPAAALKALQQHLIESLRGLDDTRSTFALESHARTLWVLALAGNPQPAYQNAMADRLANLTPTARGLLAAAIAQAAPAEPDQLAAARAVLTSKVPCTLSDDAWMPWSAEPAIELLAWTAIAPDGPEATAALDRLLNERNPYGHWRNTWANGWSIVAMSRYAQHDRNRSETAALQLESAASERILLDPASPTATRSFVLEKDLKLGVTADHNAFVRLNVAAQPAIVPLQPVARNGLAIDRIYYRVNADGSTAPLTEPKLGDLIRVVLRVTLSKDRTRYLVIEDPLPAVFETLNTEFGSQSAALGVRTSESDWNVSHSELRSDRAVFFLDEVTRKGTYSLSYLARCTLAGQATAPPAKVESMYDPENFALSASRVFTGK